MRPLQGGKIWLVAGDWGGGNDGEGGERGAGALLEERGRRGIICTADREVQLKPPDDEIVQ